MARDSPTTLMFRFVSCRVVSFLCSNLNPQFIVKNHFHFFHLSSYFWYATPLVLIGIVRIQDPCEPQKNHDALDCSSQLVVVVVVFSSRSAPYFSMIGSTTKIFLCTRHPPKNTTAEDIFWGGHWHCCSARYTMLGAGTTTTRERGLCYSYYVFSVFY